MFGVDWSNAETLWLNLTNLGLGLIVIACLAVVGRGVWGDLKERSKFRTRVKSVDREMEGLLGGHILQTPELGVLMADGGEPVKGQKASSKDKPSRKS